MSVRFTSKNAKILMEISDGRLLVDFIKQEIKKVESVSDIEVTDPTEIAVEVTAKKLVSKRLEVILSALLSGTDNTLPNKQDKEEYKM